MPTSTGAIAARNRNNAQHSTGPRTTEGKRVAAQNARKHGFTCTTHQILSNEDPNAYAAFEEEIIAIYNPKTPREHFAASEIAKCRWALRRFDEAEILLLDASILSPDQTPGQALADICLPRMDSVPRRTSTPGPAFTSLDLLLRYRRPWDRRHQEALREFNQARADRHREERLAIAQQRETLKKAMQEQRQQQKQKTQETKSQREQREMAHGEMRLGLHAPEALPERLGFVSSSAANPPKHTHNATPTSATAA